MNKIIVSLLFSLMLSVNAAAATFVITEGALNTIPTGNPVSVTINFSDATVDGLALNDFLVDINHENEFAAEINNYYADFITRFNRYCERLMLTRSGDRNIALTVNVKTINRKGNEATIEYVFTDTSTGQRLAVVMGKTKEGRFGSFSNLVGDVIQEAGGNLGQFVSRHLMNQTKVVPDPIYN